jgi:hypothetical protein
LVITGRGSEKKRGAYIVVNLEQRGIDLCVAEVYQNGEKLTVLEQDAFGIRTGDDLDKLFKKVTSELGYLRQLGIIDYNRVVKGITVDNDYITEVYDMV